MAKIPSFAPRTGNFPDTPPGLAVSTSGFGATAAAAGRLGEGMAEFASELMEKRKRAEDMDFAFTKSRERAMQFHEYKLELQRQMPRDYKGYAESLMKWVDERYTEDQSAAPSETAKKLYQEKIGTYFQSELMDASAKEYGERAKGYRLNTEELTEKIGSMLVLLPDKKYALNEMVEMRDNIRKQTGTIWSADEGQAIERASMNKMAQSLMRGYLDRGDAVSLQEGVDILRRDPKIASELEAFAAEETEVGVDEALSGGFITQEEADKLKSKNKNTKVRVPMNPKLKFSGMGVDEDVLTGSLSPEERAAWLDRFKDAMKTKKRVDRSEFRNQFQDVLEYHRGGGSEQNPAIIATLNEMEQNGEITPEAKHRAIDQLNNSVVTGQIVQRSQTAPASDFKALREGWESKRQAKVREALAKDPSLTNLARPEFNIEVRNNEKQYVELRQRQLLEERNEDGAAYVQKYLPGYRQDWVRASGSGQAEPVQNYIRKSLAAQSKLEIPPHKQRVLPKEWAEDMARQIKGLSVDDAAKSMTMLQAQFGEHYHRVIDEMIQDKQLDEGYRLVTLAPSMTDRLEIVANIRNGAETEKLFKDSHDKEDEDALKTALQTELEPFVRAITSSSSVGGVNAELNAFLTNNVRQAMRYMTNNGMDAESAAKEAAKVVFRNNFVSESAGSFNWVPRQIGGKAIKPDLIDAHKEAYKTPEGWDELKVIVPRDPNIAPERQKEAFYAWLEDNAFWADNGKKTGMYLMYRDRETGKPLHVLGANGLRIEHSFLEISERPSKRTQEAAKGFFQKAKELIF